MRHVISEAISPTIYQQLWAQAIPISYAGVFKLFHIVDPYNFLGEVAGTGRVKCPFAGPLRGREECFSPQTNLSMGLQTIF